MKFSPMCPYAIITSNLLRQPHFLRKQNFIYLNKKRGERFEKSSVLPRRPKLLESVESWNWRLKKKRRKKLELFHGKQNGRKALNKLNWAIYFCRIALNEIGCLG